MINFDDYTNGNKTEHNPEWSYIYRSSMENTYCIRFWIGEDKGIIEFNK